MNKKSQREQLEDLWLKKDSRRLIYSKLRDHNETVNLVNDICENLQHYRDWSPEEFAAIIMNMLHVVDELESRNAQLAHAHIRAETQGVDVFRTQKVWKSTCSMTEAALMQMPLHVIEHEMRRHTDTMIRGAVEAAAKMQADARKQGERQP